MLAQIFALTILLVNRALPLAEAAKHKREPSRMETLLMLDGDTSERRIYLESCKQSSVPDSCTFAIDDDINQIATSTECAVTTTELQPWFEAMLETPAFVTKVIIYVLERVFDRGRDALTDFQLSVGDQDCINYRSPHPFRNKTFACDAFADFVRIQGLHPKESVLALCEVEVYGKVVELQRNMTDDSKRVEGALLTIAACSSSGSSENCMNPVKDAGCFATNVADGPIYQLLLENPALIRTVILKGIELNAFEVLISYQLCFVYDQPSAQSDHHIKCNRFGKHVGIQSRINNSKMKLCGIQLLGFPIKFVEPPTHKYIGCFREKRYNRDLQSLAAVNRMTRDKCERICRRRKMPFFGLQQGKQCWCSERYGMYGRLAEDACWMHCDGVESGSVAECGATLVNSVYEIEEYANSRQ